MCLLGMVLFFLKVGCNLRFLVLQAMPYLNMKCRMIAPLSLSLSVKKLA
jgi:hypothetical protein